MIKNQSPSSFRQMVRLASVSLALSLAACSTTSDSQPDTLREITQAQFMPLYQQCMRSRAPLRPNRTSAAMVNETAKFCMQAARAAAR